MGILVLFVVLVSMTAVLAFMPEESVYTASTFTNKTVMVAAYDSPADSKAQADYICDGTADQVEIQRALDALGGAGGTVTLTKGTFRLSDYLHIPGNAVLEGQGPDATRLEWSSGFMLCDEDQIVLRDFTTTGTGAIWLRGISHAKIHNVVATVDDSRGGAAFTLWAQDSIVEDVEFVNCKAIDCGRHGWMNDGAGSPKLIRNVRYIDCEAINCGRDSRFDHWTTGFDFAETADIEDIEVIRCYAEGNWESGFHFEGAPSKKRVTLRDCVSKNNGQKPDNYYNDNTATYGCLFGAGFWLHGDVTLTNCIAENNRKYGYAVWSPASDINPTGSGTRYLFDHVNNICNSSEAIYGVYLVPGCQVQGGIVLYDCRSGGNRAAEFSPIDSNAYLSKCIDDGSTVSFGLFKARDVYLEDCASLNAGTYAVYAQEVSEVTIENLHITNPTGVNGNGTFLGTIAHPVLNSQFNIIGQNSADVRTIYGEGGRNITFTGVIRTDHPEPVVIRGGSDIDTRGLQIQVGSEDGC